jgi:hypothetical protein
MPDGIKGLYEYHKDKRTRPSYNELAKALQSVIGLYARAFVVIDALDECSEAAGCRKRLLSEILDLQAKLGINIFATSRTNDDLTKLLHSALSRKIYATDGDVETYLNKQMLLQDTDIFDNDMRDLTVTEIVKAAAGM